MSPATKPNFSFVLEHPPADPEQAASHFLAKLSVETDPADVHLDLERGAEGVVLVDARSAKQFEECHIPGAINLPQRSIDAESVRDIPRDAAVVTYCWGPGCNSATKAAAKFAELGYRVKEMIGGIEYWRREGHTVEGTLGDDAPLVG